MSVPEEFWTEEYEEPETTEERTAREDLERRQAEAKTELGRALQAFITLAHEDDPSAYVSDWVAITHVMSAEMEQDNASACYITTPTGQPLIVTGGLVLRAGHVISRL